MKIKSNRKKRFAILRLSAIIFALLSLIGLYIGGTKQTYADGISLSEADVKAYEQSIFYKVEYNNLKRCHSQLPLNIDVTQVNQNLADFLSSNIELNYPIFISGPSYWGDNTSRTCKDLLTSKKFSGNYTFSPYTQDSGGYVPASNSTESGRKCFYVSASLNNERHKYGAYRTGDYCVETDSNNYIKESTIEYKYGYQSSGGAKENDKNDGGSLSEADNLRVLILSESSGERKASIPIKEGNQLCIETQALFAGNVFDDKSDSPRNYDASLVYDDKTQTLCRDLPMSYDSFKNFISDIFKSVKYNNYEKPYIFDVSTISITDSTATVNTNTSTFYHRGSADAFASKFLKLTRGIDIKTGTFSNAEKYLIYRNALKSQYEVSTDYNNNGSDPVSWLKDDYTFTDGVYLNPTNTTSREPFVPYSDSVGRSSSENGTSYDWRDYTLGYDGIIKEISKIDVAEAFKDKPTALKPMIDDGGNGNGGSDSSEDICYVNGGALSWIICPIISTMRNMIDWVYGKFENWLRINPDIVTNLGSTDNALFNAWTTFRNIANIAFVILFMIIIFSQLTGYGIDNYGIKRMLPKLIVTAILVNLSYIICGLLVDISNIIGNSVKGLFESLAANNPGVAHLGSDSTVAVPKVVGLICGVGVAALGVTALIKGGLLPILLFVIAMAIGAFTILIILGVRQALAVALIVVSPLALVCMILPNTEGIYKKWLNAFKGLLVVYPIIGAVIGAGYFAASIFINTSDGGITAIIAGILMIAPYFMIPSLTRKSIDAIGNIGSRISSFGQRGSSRSQSGVRSSNFGKSMQQNHEYKQAKKYMEGGWIRNSKLGKRFNLKSRGQKVADKIEAGKRVSTGSANKYQQMANLASANEQAKIGARTAQSKYNRLQGTGYQTALSVAKNTEEEAAIKDYETQIRNGDYSYNDGKTIYENIKGDDALGKALEYELGQKEPNTSKILALQNILSKTDKGRDQMVRAMNNALERGVVSSDAVKAFSSNIMANQGDYKGTHRSLYEYAKNTFIDGSTQVMIDEVSGIQALTPSSFLGTDKTQIEAYKKFYKEGNNKIASIKEQVKNGTLTQEEADRQIEQIKTNPDRIRLEEIAHSIANNPNVHASIRKDDYGEILELLAPDVNWSAVYNGEGQVIKINHDNGGGQVQTQVQIQPESQPQPQQQASAQQQPQSQPQPTQAQPQPVPQQTSQAQPQQSQQSTPTQPQPAPQQASQPQQQQKTDYTERLKEEIIQRNMNGEISDDNMIELLKMVNGSNNQNPNNS